MLQIIAIVILLKNALLYVGYGEYSTDEVTDISHNWCHSITSVQQPLWGFCLA